MNPSPVQQPSSPDPQVGPCQLCGYDGPGRYWIGPDGGSSWCEGHTWCAECQTFHLVERDCPERVRVHTVEHARLLGASVHADLARVGIQLPRPPLRLTGHLPPGQLGWCEMTTAYATDGVPVRTARVEILAGLGPTQFAMAYAHECTHALLHLSGRASVAPDLAEGVCEMVSMVWLTATRPTARPLMAGAWANPDPVYGGQMRRVVAAARRHGVPAVLGSVLNRGTLPN